MKKTKTYSRHTLDAARLLGLEVARARRQRRWTLEELATRADVTRTTASKVERGDPTVALGTAFEIAWLVGVPLFGATDRASLADKAAAGRDRLAVLPTRVRRTASHVPSADF